MADTAHQINIPSGLEAIPGSIDENNLRPNDEDQHNILPLFEAYELRLAICLWWYCTMVELSSCEHT